MNTMGRLSSYLGQIRMALKPKTSKLVIAISAAVYIIFYFWATNLLIFGSSNEISIWISDRWESLLFRERAPFNWEPVGILFLGPLQFFLAIPNIIFGIIISLLVGINIAVSVFTYRYRKLCRINPSQSVAMSIPSLLTGIACCGPSLLLSLGVASVTGTIALVSVLPFLLPLALLGLIFSILWSGYRLAKVESEASSGTGDEIIRVTIE